MTAAFYAELRALRLERLLDASVEIITDQGWDALSMTEVARRSGIPRQSLYKEVGTRADLGRAVVDRELGQFLERVRVAVEAHPGSVEDGITAAARETLQHGRANAVVAAVLRPGQDPALLALVTIDPDAVLGQATTAVVSLLDDPALEPMVDSVVRLTVSHLLQPTVDVEEATSRIRRTAAAFL